MKIFGIDLDTSVTKILCFPDVEEKENRDLSKDLPADINVIFKETLCSPETLAQKLRKICLNANISKKLLNETWKEAFLNFMALIVAHRSVVHLSQARNVLHIHQFIESGNLFSKKHNENDQNMAKNRSIRFKFNDQEEQIILLTPTQWDVMKCTEQRQIIVGPPGTGKTLLLMKKIEEETMKEREAEILVFTKSKSLCCKFLAFFKCIEGGCKREPKIIDSIKALRDQDDFFADEEMFDTTALEVLENRCREKVTGKTVVAFTGRHYPKQVNETNLEIAQANLSAFYRTFRLTAIMRSSNAIAKFYKDHFPEASVGHRFEVRLI